MSGETVRDEAARDLGVSPEALIVGQERFRAWWDVDGLAAGAVAAFGDALAALVAGDGIERAVRVDRDATAVWFRQALQPVGWALPSPWDPVSGDHRAADGWIRLHMNAPRHRAAGLRVLGLADGAERDEVATAAGSWPAAALEDAVAVAGGAAAVMRTAEGWAQHPQGLAVAVEPLIARTRTDVGADRRASSRERPLQGVRVLDLTRVLAGPVATRALAAYGADVLRIDPPDWDEPAVVPDMTLGKRTARLDATTPAGRDRLLGLLAGADVLVHGYRRDALDGLGLGLGEAVRRRTRPGLVEVALTAYGWTGPWAGRRGFDSLVQMSAGIAERGAAAQEGRPLPLPVQALDHATGWLTAAAAVTGLRDRGRDGRGSVAHLSLARTAIALRPLERPRPREEAEKVAGRPLVTPWGPATIAQPPLDLPGVALRLRARSGPARRGRRPLAGPPRIVGRAPRGGPTSARRVDPPRGGGSTARRGGRAAPRRSRVRLRPGSAAG